MNVDKAYEVEQGLLVENGPFYTGGAASPVGLDLPTSTLYLQTTAGGVLIWRKFNTGVNDWRQLSAQDIPYVNTGGDLTATNTKTALDALANRNFGKEYDYDELAIFETALGSFQTVIVDSAIRPAGTYRVGWSFTVTNSKANTTNITRALVNAVEIYTRTQIGDSINSVGGFKGNIIHPGGALTYTIQTRVSAGNGLAQLSEIRAELWRVA